MQQRGYSSLLSILELESVERSHLQSTPLHELFPGTVWLCLYLVDGWNNFYTKHHFQQRKTSLVFHSRDLIENRDNKTYVESSSSNCDCL
jgi:hypothetical protein